MRTNRRDFVKTLGVGFIGTGLGLGISQKLLAEQLIQSGEITANSKYGQIRGTLLNDVGVFRGIPYAGPSDGPNRFLAPTPVVPWTGVREAIAFGAKSYQANTTWIDQSLIMRENCQYLNIWTPSVKSGKKLPVMFWNHGGGFTGGPSVFDGTNLAKTGDVVVVTHTHRLNMMGYLYLGHLDKKYEQSGNAGMLDILAALRWVKENIAEFGGDPDNITIFGQSGGGGKVFSLMAMPMAVGMFQKAIVMSGVGGNPAGRALTKDEAIASTDKVFNKLGLKAGDINGLLALPAQTLIEKGAPAGSFSPVVDGNILPYNTYQDEAIDISAKIPFMIGTCIEEQGRPPEGNVAILEAIRGIAGDKTDAILSLHAKYYPEYDLDDIFRKLNADAGMRKLSIMVAEKKLQKPAPVYMYRYDYGDIPEGRTVRRAKHSGELTFVFDCVGEVPLSDPAYVIPTDKTPALAKNMAKAWAAFAHNGNPEHEGIPHWPTYSLKDRSTMIFDLNCNMINDPDKEIREIIAAM